MLFFKIDTILDNNDKNLYDKNKLSKNLNLKEKNLCCEINDTQKNEDKIFSTFVFMFLENIF